MDLDAVAAAEFRERLEAALADKNGGLCKTPVLSL